MTAYPSAVRVTIVRSGRCVPPAYGSFRIHGSPGVGSCDMTAATASGIAPRWTGMCSACVTIRPPSSNSAVEQSRRSLMLAENAERTSTAPISSAIARSEAPITWSSIGITPSSAGSSVPCGSVSPAQPAGTQAVAPSSSSTCGPVAVSAGPEIVTSGAFADLGRPHRDELERRGRDRRSRTWPCGPGESAP